MSSESYEFDNISSTEDMELTEFSRSSDSLYSDSGSSAYLAASSRWSIEQSKIVEDKDNDVAITSLNTSDENHHEFDIEQVSLSSLKGTSTGDLTRTRISSSERQASVSIRKASSLKGPSIRRVSSLDSLVPSIRRASSLNFLKGPSTKRILSVDSLEEYSIRRVSSLDSLEGLSRKRVSSLDPLEGPLGRRAKSLNYLKGALTRRVSSEDYMDELTTKRVSSMEGPSTRRVSSLNTLKGPLTRRVSSEDYMDELTTKRVSSMGYMEGPSTRRVSSLNSLKGPLTRRVSSEDSLEEHLIRRVSSLDPLEGSSTISVSSQDPLEGPSTRRVWFSDPAESSLTSINTSYNSETETNDEPLTQQNESWFRNFLRRYSRQIRHSRYYLLFHLALLFLPCSAGYMGSKYQQLCGGCPKLPFLVYMLGILGMWIITIRIAAILSKRYFAVHLTGHEFDSWMVSILLIFFMCLLIAMVTVFICEPVFNHPLHHEFCIKVFYNYAYYLNVILPLVILLLLLIHIPGCFDPAEDE